MNSSHATILNILHFLNRHMQFDIILKLLFLIIGVLELVILFRQIEIILKDSSAFVYLMKSEKSSHLCKMS